MMSVRKAALLALLWGTSAIFGVGAWADQPYVQPPPRDAPAQVERQQTQPLNNAPVWREVRSGEPGITQVQGIETGVLVQSEGERWRAIRNGPITLYGGLLLLVVPVAVLLFYFWKGPLTTHGALTGREIERFDLWDRTIHWTTAISFVILAITGILLLFGKHFILPVFGYTVFSWLAIASKNLHNFVGPLFIFCSIVMFVSFVKANLWRAYDWMWVKKAGGMFTKEHVPSGRFNAGEKAWFWGGVVFLGIIVGVSGVILNFPNFEQGRATMQYANMIHGIAALLYMAASLGHIYMGTIGVEGSFKSMKTGYVDETWAKEHHQYWYEELEASHRAPADDSAPAHRPQPQH
jgi:formate dehydrogenase subunit gamma